MIGVLALLWSSAIPISVLNSSLLHRNLDTLRDHTAVRAELQCIMSAYGCLTTIRGVRPHLVSSLNNVFVDPFDAKLNGKCETRGISGNSEVHLRVNLRILSLSLLAQLFRLVLNSPKEASYRNEG
mgnify:CR=1 FL=1